MNIAKMAKFDEKSRFLRDGEAGNVRKNVRKRLENARKWSRTVRIFQKATVGVSLVKQSVRQNEMGGGFWWWRKFFKWQNYFSRLKICFFFVEFCHFSSKIRRLDENPFVLR